MCGLHIFLIAVAVAFFAAFGFTSLPGWAKLAIYVALILFGLTLALRSRDE